MSSWRAVSGTAVKLHRKTSAKTSTVQDGAPTVQFGVTVPEGSKEEQVMTLVLPDGRPRTTDVPAGLRAGDKFPVNTLTPVLPGKKGGDEMEHSEPGGKRRKVPIPEEIEAGQAFETVGCPSAPMDVGSQCALAVVWSHTLHKFLEPCVPWSSPRKRVATMSTTCSGRGAC